MGFAIEPKKSITIAFMCMENDGVVVSLTETEVVYVNDTYGDEEQITNQKCYAFAKANKAVRFVNENIKSMLAGLKTGEPEVIAERVGESCEKVD